jgi:hypothetical protein
LKIAQIDLEISDMKDTLSEEQILMLDLPWPCCGCIIIESLLIQQPIL